MPSAEVCQTLTPREELVIATPGPDTSDDATLLRRYATAGDSAAAEELLRRHLDFLYRTALRWHGRAPDADDAVQTALLNVLQQARQFRGQGSVRSWLLTVLLNVLRRQARDTQSQRAREEQMAATRESTTALKDDSELAQAAVLSVNGLPQHYRLPLSLHFLEQMSMREVAAALDIPEKTVRSQIDRGLELVRQSLAATGYAVALPALPAVFAAAHLAPAPLALSATVHALVLNATAKGAATAGALAGSKSAGAGVFALKAGIPTLLAIGALTAALHFSNAVMPTLPVTKGDAPAPVVAAPTVTTSADVPADLAGKLAMKVDVNFYRDYPIEVLQYLRSQTGLPYAMADAAQQAGTLHLKQTSISVRDVLDKMAAACGLEVEVAHGRVLLWKKADEDILKLFHGRLKDSDRWVRARTAWELSSLGDKRVPGLLLQACADKDVGVTLWAARGLNKFLNVLPYVDGDRAPAVAAAKRLCTLKSWDLRFELLGALSTPEATAALIGYSESLDPSVRSRGISGLARDRQPQALEYLLGKTVLVADVEPSDSVLPWEALEAVLADALGQSEDPRAIDALLTFTRKPRAREVDQNRVGHAVAALARFNTPQACARVAELLKNPEIFTCMFPSKHLQSMDPAVLNVCFTYLHDPDENKARIARWTLGAARDPRALDAMVTEANDRSNINARWVDEIAASRDPRGEELVVKHYEESKSNPDEANYQGSPGLLLLATRNPKKIDRLIADMKDERKDLPARLAAASTLTFATQRTPEQESDILAWIGSADRKFRCAMVLHGHGLWSNDARWTALLEELKQDSDPKVRDAVAGDMHRREDPAAMKATIETLRNGDAESRRQILDVNAQEGELVRSGEPLIADAMAQLLTNEDRDTQAAAACALGVIHDARAPVPLLAQLALTPAPDQGFARITYDGQCTPRAALLILATNGNADAARALHKLVRVPELDSDFLDNMVKSHEPVLVKTVADVALDATVPSLLRLTAVMAVYSYGTDAATRSMMAQLMRDQLSDPETDPKARVSILSVLVRTGEAKDLDLVFEQMRQITVERSSDVGDLAYARPKDVNGFVQHLVKFIGDSTINLNLRSEAAGALLKFRDRHEAEMEKFTPGPAELLIQLSSVGAVSDMTRQRRWNALMETKDPVALEFVRRTLKSGEFHDRMIIAGWLALSKGDHESVSVLIELLKDSDAKNASVAAASVENCAKQTVVSDADQKRLTEALAAYRKTLPNPFEQKEGF